MSRKKRSSKNLKINTRIALTSVLTIIIPLIILGSFSSVFVQTLSSFFNYSSVTTNTYSTINQIQWVQTLAAISEELTSSNDEDKKHRIISEHCIPLENIGSKIYIEKNNQQYYATADKKEIFDFANSLIKINTAQNTNYFSDNGLVIITHALSQSNDNYMIMVVKSNYNVDDVVERFGLRDFRSFILSRTGIVVGIIAFTFIAAIVIFSFITTKTIVKPIEDIARGADEIARGNLDYEIDYESTNELGQTVNSFNEMRLKLKQSIEKKNKIHEERKILVAGIAHDLRTPLTSAKAYAEGIKDGIATTEQMQRKYADTICQSIASTEKILDDLLAFSSIEIKGFELSKENIKIKDFFDDGATEIKNILETKGFEFEYISNCNENTVVSIDTDRFVRVINNIISNSVKYARDNIKGKIILNITEYEHSIIAEIADNGTGVEKENLSKIFDIMYREDKSRTKISNGSGLGLSICKQIVELHNGSIWAGSNANNGLSIFISIPKVEVDYE